MSLGSRGRTSSPLMPAWSPSRPLPTSEATTGRPTLIASMPTFSERACDNLAEEADRWAQPVRRKKSSARRSYLPGDVAKRQVPEPHVLGGRDTVLDPGMPAVA